jgi:hypothetical protein
MQPTTGIWSAVPTLHGDGGDMVTLLVVEAIAKSFN